MRFEADAPYPEIVKTLPHVAFEVDDLKAAIKGEKVIIQPNSPSLGTLVAFIDVDGVPVELLQIDHAATDSISSENDASPRWTAPGVPPSQQQLESWLGKKAYGFWQQAMKLIAVRHPGVFTPEWLFGGKRHGWSVRYKKNKSFCTMAPEKGRCLLVVVFGAKERAKFEGMRSQFSATVQETYDKATTYHDGKWLVLNINSKAALADAEALLALKRKPKQR
jgi:hypothetical protein